MDRRNSYLLIAIAALTIAVIIALVGLASAQRRTVEPQHWIPFIRQEREPATPVANIGIMYVDPNGDACYKDIDGKKSIFAGDNVTYNISNLAIDGNVIYVDAADDSIGFFTATPAASAGIQYSDKFVVCDTFTSAGINACIDALGSEGGEVYLPEGTYAITTSVVIDVDNITLRGAGGGTILTQGADCDGISVYNVASTIDNCLIENLVYDGAAFAMSANTYLIEAGDVDNFVVRNVTLKNYEEGALYINVNNQRDGAAVVDACTFLDASDTSSIAIYYKNASGNYLTGIHITNCEFKVCDVGIYMEEPGAIVDNCKFTDCKDYAISTSSGGPNLGTIISNNIFYSNDSYDIYLLNARDIIISSNVFSASGNSAIYINAGYFHQISDNLFQAPENITSIIYSNAADYCNIINNHFDFDTNDADYCIYLNSHATENTIAGNLFDPSVDTAAIYMDTDATGNVFYGNQNTSFSGSGSTYGDFEVYAQVGIDVDPNANAYFQISDKYIVCKTFTSAGIQACCDVLGAEGGHLYLPEGNYVITAAVDPPCKYLKITGAGESTILSLGADVHMFDLGATADTRDSYIFEDLVFDGNSINTTAKAFIYSSDNYDVFRCENCVFRNYSDYAIYTGNSSGQEAYFNKCTFEDATQNLSIAIFSYYTYLVVEDCYFDTIDCAVKTSNKAIIKNNNCYFTGDSTNFTFYLSNVSGVLSSIVEGNYIYNYYGIYSGQAYSTITNNHFSLYSSKAISLSGASYSDISNNIIQIKGDYGIYANNTDYLHIAENQIRGSGGVAGDGVSYAIKLTGGCENTTIVDNFCFPYVEYNWLVIDSTESDYMAYNNTYSSSAPISINASATTDRVMRIYGNFAVEEAIEGDISFSGTINALSYDDEPLFYEGDMVFYY